MPHSSSRARRPVHNALFGIPFLPSPSVQGSFKARRLTLAVNGPISRGQIRGIQDSRGYYPDSRVGEFWLPGFAPSFFLCFLGVCRSKIRAESTFRFRERWKFEPNETSLPFLTDTVHRDHQGVTSRHYGKVEEWIFDRPEMVTSLLDSSQYWLTALPRASFV